MVSRGYYGEDEPSFHRYSSRGNGYPLSDLPPGSSSSRPGARVEYSVPPREKRRSDQVNEQESGNPNPRKRIPVACGRCRKRKIRCSGDPGNGLPCTNCKSAGADSCLFLRVSSTEAQMRSDAGEFDYDPNRVPYRVASHLSNYNVQSYSPQSPIDGFSYRSSPLSLYQYPASAYRIPWNDITEENSEYGVQNHGYPIIGQENINSPSSYGQSGNVRVWNTGASPRGPAIFIDQESYSQAQLPIHGGSIHTRSSISPESRGISLNNMISPLSSSSGNDRMLPFPATNRLISSFSRPCETILPSSQVSSPSYVANLVSPSMMQHSRNTGNVTMSESGTIASYMPLSSTNSDSISFTSQSVHTQSNEPYTSNNDDIYHNENSSSTDLSYSYGTGPLQKRGSQSSQTDSEESPPSASGGLLANGRPYIPHKSSNATYPAPPMEIQNSAPPGRRPMGSIQAI